MGVVSASLFAASSSEVAAVPTAGVVAAVELLAAIPSPDLKALWDPANALVAGEAAFPGG